MQAQFTVTAAMRASLSLAPDVTFFFTERIVHVEKKKNPMIRDLILYKIFKAKISVLPFFPLNFS